MIDWYGLFANSLWIAAMAFVLALISRASWQASRKQVKFSVLLNKSQYQAGLYLAGVLFCSGLALTSNSILQIVIWAGLGITCLIRMLMNFRDGEKFISML
jgi:hypothetical protein